MIVGLSKSFCVQNTGKFIGKFNHRFFAHVGPSRVNQFVKQHIQKFFTVQLVGNANRACGVAAITVSIGGHATTQQSPTLASNVNNVSPARHTIIFHAICFWSTAADCLSWHRGLFLSELKHNLRIRVDPRHLLDVNDWHNARSASSVDISLYCLARFKPFPLCFRKVKVFFN